MSDQLIFKPNRRTLIKGLVSASGTALLGSRIGDVLAQSVAPAAVTSERLRPQVPGGVMSRRRSGCNAVRRRCWVRDRQPLA